MNLPTQNLQLSSMVVLLVVTACSADPDDGAEVISIAGTTAISATGEATSATPTTGAREAASATPTTGANETVSSGDA